MIFLSVLLITALCLLPKIVNTAISNGECSSNLTGGSLFSLTVKRVLDQQNGDWIRTFTVENTHSEDPLEDIILEATHSNVQCQGKYTARLKVAVREVKSKQSPSSSHPKTNYLVFHQRHGRNAMVFENGRVAQKIDSDDPYNAVLFTNRPLANDELFEIRLEKKVIKNNAALGIGVVSYSPDVVQILPQMHVRNETWIMHHNNIYTSQKAILESYGKNLNKLEVNDRVGVMRRENAKLHFFMNGVDQGAAVDVPENVYGIVELWHDANRVKIVY